jgi:hypothetical protein
MVDAAPYARSLTVATLQQQYRWLLQTILRLRRSVGHQPSPTLLGGFAQRCALAIPAVQYCSCCPVSPDNGQTGQNAGQQTPSRPGTEQVSADAIQRALGHYYLSGMKAHTSDDAHADTRRAGPSRTYRVLAGTGLLDHWSHVRGIANVRSNLSIAIGKLVHGVGNAASHASTSY